jgi:hypothetical protein
VIAGYATESTDISMVDSNRYKTLLMRAAETVIRPIEQHFGIMAPNSNYNLFPDKKAESMNVGDIHQLDKITLASFFNLRNKPAEVY